MNMTMNLLVNAADAIQATGRLDGHVRVALTTTKGRGTTATVRLPLAAKDP